jgi:hypothetical protein
MLQAVQFAHESGAAVNLEGDDIGDYTSLITLGMLQKVYQSGEVLGLPLLYLLVTLHASQATGPRDKVYALLGLVSRIIVSGDRNFVPDYNLPLHEVYTRTA